MKKTPELFDASNQFLKQIEFSHGALQQVSIGEFWWYFEGVNIGQEISKDGTMKRPCLIIRSIVQSSLIRILPMTSKIHPLKSHKIQLIKWQIHGLKKPSALLLYQLKCIDKKRLIKRIKGKKATHGFLEYIFSMCFG